MPTLKAESRERRAAPPPTVLLIGTLDTKGRETAFFADAIRALGCATLVLDSGILGEADGIAPDFDRRAVARAAGSDIDAIRASGSRGKAVERMLGGVRAIALELHAAGKIHGVAALGGAEGSVLAAAAMRALPVGFPKLLVSPIASGRRTFGPFVGTKDVMVMHSVIDILGLHRLARDLFESAAAAIAGMARAFAARAERPPLAARPRIAATMLGNTTRPLMRVRERLDAAGYDLVLFHANGAGGAAMEELIERDRSSFACVIDYTLSEVAAEIAGGFHRPPSPRLVAAGARGVPQLVVPGCVDFVVCGPRAEVPDAWRGRASYFHNPEFTLVRVTKDEQVAIARTIAERANAAVGPIELLIPARGLSIPNRPGGEFEDAAADDAFRAELAARLNPSIPRTVIDAHVNDDSFADAALAAALRLAGGDRHAEDQEREVARVADPREPRRAR